MPEAKGWQAPKGAGGCTVFMVFDKVGRGTIGATSAGGRAMFVLLGRTDAGC